MTTCPSIAIWHPNVVRPLEEQALQALVLYLSALTVATVERLSAELPDSGGDIVIVGQVDALRTRGVEGAGDVPAIPGSYRIRRTRSDGGAMIAVIAGADAEGTRSGVFAFLEELGCSFHLHGDILPERVAALPPLEFDIARTPRFALRGMQLWNYWYVGRDSWSFEDYDAYLTQFPKLGLNLFDFPLYLYEPLFTGYRYQNHLVDGHVLAGIDTGLARIGGDIFAGAPRFSSPDIPGDAPQDERNRAAIALMRRVFARARELGIKTCVDIELSSLLHSNPALLATMPHEDRFDGGTMLAPSSPSGRELLRTRLDALISAYPECDFYGVWQPEGVTMFASEGSPHPDDVAFRRDHVHLADRLSPSDLDYAHSLRMAHAILKEIKPGAVIATGGWGAERIIAAADELLPTDIVRSTMGYYEPQLTLKTDRLANYGHTAGSQWHITWGEVDQHMWVLQPKTRTTATVLNELEMRGVDGALLLHWRRLFSDLDISLFAKGCWSGHDRDDALSRWLQRKFGTAAEAPMRLAVDALEEFNLLVCDIDRIEQSIFWVGFDCGVGGVLFAHRYIGSGDPLPEMWLNDGVRPNLTVNVSAIEILRRAAEHGAQAMALARGAHRERLQYFYDHIRLTLALHESHLVVAQAILAVANAQADGDEQAGYRRALDILGGTDPERIVHDFAQTLTKESPDKGELGLLLSLNVKFVGGVRRLEGRLKRALAIQPPLLTASPRAKLFVACAANSVQRSYRMAHDSSMIWTYPHTIDADRIEASEGFGVQAGPELTVGRVNPDTGCWLQSGELSFSIIAPPKFRGRLRLYMYYEPDFDSAFCWQEIFVDGGSLGVQRDYFCRGRYWDEGVWIESDVTVSADGTPIAVRIVARGRLDARLSAIELIDG